MQGIVTRYRLKKTRTVSKLFTVNYVQKGGTKKNKAIISLQLKNTYKTNQKLNSNRREDSHSSLRDVGMMDIGCLRKNNTCNAEHIKKKPTYQAS